MIEFTIKFSDEDHRTLSRIAVAHNISEAEVIRRGLQLIALYAKTKYNPDAGLYWVDPETKESKKLII